MEEQDRIIIEVDDSEFDEQKEMARGNVAVAPEKLDAALRWLMRRATVSHVCPTSDVNPGFMIDYQLHVPRHGTTEGIARMDAAAARAELAEANGCH